MLWLGNLQILSKIGSFLRTTNYLFTEVFDSRNASVTNVIEEVLGREPKDFTEYVSETAITRVWNIAG